ncbi:MAG: FtsX-like permease family protein [Candidatus Cloacimonas sp.]|nr:FtsX-like permease family protein [Candidatus Cloacimonas sp.]
MIFKLALRNIIGNGWRSLINIFIIAFVMIGLIWMIAMWYSWLNLAKTQQKEWEFASGIMRVKSYDPYDMFSWEKANAPVPVEAQAAVAKGSIVPILFSPCVIYPNGRMVNAIVKGIPAKQRLLKIPSAQLSGTDESVVPALIGKAMAISTRLKEKDIFTLRIKDSEGAFNAIDLQVSQIMDCPVPSLDAGTVWIDIQALQSAKQLPDMATVMVINDNALSILHGKEFRAIGEREFFADLNQMVKTKAEGQSSLFILLVFLAMLAVFDTQALAIFKRRKEIGMLSAMGLSKGKIILLFTTEGSLYMVFASVVTAVLGFPIFYYFAKIGFSLPYSADNFGVAGFDEPLKFIYPAPLVFATLLLMFLLTVFVSWLPARKIAKMKPTDALRGR